MEKHVGRHCNGTHHGHQNNFTGLWFSLFEDQEEWQHAADNHRQTDNHVVLAVAQKGRQHQQCRHRNENHQG